jgi:hypothetical protein
LQAISFLSPESSPRIASTEADAQQQSEE